MVPSTSVDFTEPGKKSLASISLGVASNELAKSPIQVVPIWATSGVVPPAMAVWYLLSAASQGMAVTLTLTPGFSASKSLRSAGRASPSLPWAHRVMVPDAWPEAMGLADDAADEPAVSLPQPVISSAAARPMAAAFVAFGRIIIVPFVGPA
ncbi:hypothetical protein D9M72_468200 [compost metagenome]